MPTSWNNLSNHEFAVKVGESVRALRLKLNLTQSELAKKSGISTPSLVRLELGTGNPSLILVFSLLRALGKANYFEHLFAAQESPLLVFKGTQGKSRQRAGKALSLSINKSPQKGFTWGDENQ